MSFITGQQQTNSAGARALDPAIERVFLRSVFAWMFVGLALTAGIAAWFGSNDQVMQKLLANPAWIIAAMFVEVGLVLALSLGIRKISAGMATFMFVLYAGVKNLQFF